MKQIYPLSENPPLSEFLQHIVQQFDPEGPLRLCDFTRIELNI